MSNQSNDNLIERATDLLEEIDSHPSGLDTALDEALKKGDLDEIHRLVTYIEAELARDHFHRNNYIGQNDIY